MNITQQYSAGYEVLHALINPAVKTGWQLRTGKILITGEMVKQVRATYGV